MSIAWCGICDDLNTKFQASTYSSNYLRAPYHNFFPRVLSSYSPRRTAFFTIIPSYFLFLRHIFSRLVNWMKHSSLVLVLQRSASELWNLLFLTRWHLSLQCLVDTSTFHILWEQTLGIMRASLYIWWSMICTFVSHRILIIKCSQFISLNCWVALAFISTKSWFLCSSMWSRCLFPLTFLRYRFFTAMQKVEVKFTMRKF